MIRHIMKYMIPLFATVFFLATTAGRVHAQDFTQADVDKQAQIIAEALKRMQNADGSFRYAGGNYGVGATSLVVFALASAGYDESDPAVARAVGYISSNRTISTYEEGLAACALEKINPVKYKDRIKYAHEYLIGAQIQSGGWGYNNLKKAPYNDESCSQYAVLGLNAAEKAGFEIPKKTRDGALFFYRSMQKDDGGWGYCGRNPSVSMTCAGLASYRLLGEKMEIPVPGRCGVYKDNRIMQAGLKWLERNAKQFLQTFHFQQWGYYALYGLERVCILNGIKELNGIDWYREGCRNILVNDNWKSDVVSASFVLLFIARNSAPYAITKWEWNGDWEPDKYDVPNWVEGVSQKLNRPLDWQTAKLGGGTNKAGRASMIFVSGHGEFKASDAELEELRQYLADGGILVAEACCGDKTFFKSFMNLMETKLDKKAGMHFSKVPAEHPIMSSVNQMTPAECPIYMLKKGCGRFQVYLLEKDISCALNGDTTAPAEIERARKISENILVFALGKRKPKAKFEKVEYEKINVDDLLGPELKEGSAELYKYDNPLGRVKHGGEWNTDQAFNRGLTKAFAKNPDLPVFDAEVPVDPETNEIYACKVLLLTGHGAPELSQKAVVNLRNYITNGGKIIAEACCSDAVFDAAFRKLVTGMFPGRRLEAIPRTDQLYTRPYEIFAKPPQTTAAWKKANGDKYPEAYGIRSQDGAWDLIYFPYDVTCAMDGDLEEDIIGLKASSAAELLANTMTLMFGTKSSEKNGGDTK